MTRSVAEWQDELQKLDRGPVMSSQLGDASQMAPGARLLWLKAVLSELDLPTDFLMNADELAARASAMRTNAVLGQQQAVVRRAAAVNTLAQDPEATIADAAAEWQQQSLWLDLPPNQTLPPALQIAEDAARRIEGQITAVIYASHAPRIFGLAQKKAAEIVAEVAALPAMPRQLWEIHGAPADELAKFREHRSTWGTLTATWADFQRCHSVADLVRDQLGYAKNSFPLGAPRTALWLKNWRRELGDTVFAQQKAPLRIRYAIDHGYGPGLWAPRDVEESTAADRSFGGRLQNLKSAAGVNF